MHFVLSCFEWSCSVSMGSPIYLETAVCGCLSQAVFRCPPHPKVGPSQCDKIVIIAGFVRWPSFQFSLHFLYYWILMFDHFSEARNYYPCHMWWKEWMYLSLEFSHIFRNKVINYWIAGSTLQKTYVFLSKKRCLQCWWKSQVCCF